MCISSSSPAHKPSPSPAAAALSAAPAAISTVLFALCELYHATSPTRALQLWAAIILCVLAAVHTHVVLGRSLKGWKMLMPFQGGFRFVQLQTLGWSLFGLALLLGLCILTFNPSLSGLPSLIGFIQLAAQSVLFLSLAQFNITSETYYFGCKCLSRKQVPAPAQEGVPVSLVVTGLVLGVALLAGAISRSECPSQAAGWSILATLVMLQASGIHIMWTITWNIIATAAYLIGSDFFLAVAACMGIANINGPWYIGRVFFWKTNYPDRALVGQCHWAVDVVLGSLHGYYPDEIAYKWFYCGFLGVDQVLHILPGMMLLQHCSKTVTPYCVLISFLLSVCWGVTVSLKHKVLDWSLLHRGLFKLVPFGSSSVYEPHAIGQIYLFENPSYPDNRFMDDITQWMCLFGSCNLALLVISMLPNSASIVFLLGGGPFLSMGNLVALSCFCGLVCVVCFGLGLAKTIAFVVRAERAKLA